MIARMVFATALLLSGCGRSPTPTLYTLVARPDGPTYPVAGLVVEVRRPNIAGYLDRREIVQRVAAQQLDVSSEALWAEPLATMLGRVLASDLAQRLPRSQVVTDQAALAARADIRVDVDMQRFEQDEGKLVLEAQIGVRAAAASGPVLSRVVLAAQPDSGSVQLHVAGMNRLVAELADRVAQSVALAAATGVSASPELPSSSNPSP